MKITVDYFKASGKWYMEKEVEIPDNITEFYGRREYLINICVGSSFKYCVSFSEHLGFPFMHINEEAE
ncbi:hypothetical protein HCC36_10930 [Listeria booriae]|uniref:Uncharacterized protein n=1 Tax=Listeria booriae TaxID=1552123 RepID=A0A842GAV5_9LIST|nr:hypothetical protein [Listeria booriae]MBC2293742.1 hypothetical protein [Listeria booriae]